MDQSCGRRARAQRRASGGTRLNFLLVLAILIVGGYVGAQLVPVYYRGTLLQTFMQDTVNLAAVASKPPGWVEQQLRAGADDYALPPDALIETTTRDARTQLHVKFSRNIPLIVTIYHYEFDHTVRSATIGNGG
jgi:hypothetical protein